MEIKTRSRAQTAPIAQHSTRLSMVALSGGGTRGSSDTSCTCSEDAASGRRSCRSSEHSVPISALIFDADAACNGIRRGACGARNPADRGISSKRSSGKRSSGIGRRISWCFCRCKYRVGSVSHSYIRASVI